MHAIQSLDQLPSIEQVRTILKGLALLDAVLSPEWDYRYFSYNARWVQDGSEAMASMRDGCGSEYFVLFDEVGVAGKVYSTDAADETDNPDLIPEIFSGFRNEPAFSVQFATFYFWRGKNDASWAGQPTAANDYHLLRFIVDGPDYYHAWAEAYYERSIDLDTVLEVYHSGTLTRDQAFQLAPDLVYADLTEDIAEITGV
ncbi:hypothetical protein ABAC460_08240 [Asticcacaulis sp. AC460]|uniref:hypothetical protein n=1 Tax=Asticcacaulis sp. AC460 TaxID=1282360 RepID=UPI0003C3EC5D|nr:hypothetical protein [Asticcacaulis sp. AC460]ESQ90809.1 hypothetical protein ABAC460_08240 [Asticcacaulis sp. AC460]